MGHRERRHSFGPTIYHEEDVDVKRPPRVFYEDVTHEKLRHPASLNSHPPTGAHSENNRYHQTETGEGYNRTDLRPDSPQKPVFYETVEDQRGGNEKGFTERNSYMEKPYNMAEENRSFVGYGYSDYDHYHRSRRRPGRYSPPPISGSYESSELAWTRVRHALREPLAEFFGVFILVLFGDGSIAQVVLSNNNKGDYQSICWGYGLGVMLGVYTAGISGANINPAVTFTNCVFRKQPWHKFPIYAIAQILGAFCAAGVLYGNYKSAIDIYEGGVGVRTVPGYSTTATAGIFATYPADFVSRTTEFFNEFICATILMFCIYMLQDKKNMGAGKLLPLALFFVVFGIGTSFGWQTGYAINMARDFGPRLMTFCVGYGKEVWTANNHYFWIPMVAPFLGCLFGAWLYDMFLFTGESPVNTPWMGLRRLIKPNRSNDNFV